MTSYIIEQKSRQADKQTSNYSRIISQIRNTEGYNRDR